MIVKFVEVLQMFGEDGLVVIHKDDITLSAGGPFINATLYLISVVS